MVYLTFNYSYMNGQINLIVNGSTDAGSGSTEAGVTARFLGLSKTVDIATLQKNLDDTMSGVSQLFSDLQQKAVAGWELEDVTVSLAISAEGSIGIATAGVEAGIEVTWRPKQ
jgi:hypothetical protein